MSWIIYKHTCPSGKVYIGQTCQSANRRWRDGKGYEGQVFYNAVLKYGWENIKHEILLEGIETQEKCNELEIYYIAHYKSYIAKYGYNVDLGGHVFAKEHTENFGKHLRKEIYQIDDNLDIVNEFESCSDAARFLHISKAPIFRCANKFESKDGRHKSIKAAGYYWCWKSEYEAWTPPVKKAFHSYRPIYQIDTKTLKPVDRFENGLQIERHFGKKVAPSINSLLHKKAKYITVLQSYWCYVDEYYDGWTPVRTVETNKNFKRQVSVLCISVDDLSVVKEFKSVSDANKWLGIDERNTSIGKVLSGESIVFMNYYWCKKSNYTKDWRPRENNNTRMVICIETGKKYASLSDAIKCGDASKNLSRACRDSGLTSNGKHWAYLDEYTSNYKIRKRKSTSKKVQCIETQEIFESATAASKKYNADNSEISKCCKNPTKTCKGYHWQYID